MAKENSVKDGKSQLDKFKEAAREIECDDDEQRFKDRLSKLAKPSPSHTSSSD